MCCTLDCSENIRTALKPGARTWSLVPPEPRLQVPPGLLQSVPGAMSSCQGAQDRQHRSKDLLSKPWRPSSDVAKCWALATSPGMPEEQDKGGHQQYWIHTTLLTGSLHKTELGFTAWPCSHPATLRLPHGHIRQQALLWIVLQDLQGNLHLPPAA